MPDLLRTDSGIAAPDEFYEKLLSLHDGLDAAASARLNARLVLLLANHIGDRRVIDEALDAARNAGVVPTDHPIDTSGS
jgi:hypothetical protein